MGTEIERKFLVQGEAWRSSPATYLCQGYLNRDKQRTVRVRIAGELGYLTIKGQTQGATRSEFEYSIPFADARQMLAMCDGPVVEKRRYVVDVHGLTWEVDEFLGDNAGLIIAEVELESEDQEVELPDWVGLEVTDDPRYYNSNLATHPYKAWSI
jgi:CYTH domain-containing protein